MPDMTQAQQKKFETIAKRASEFADKLATEVHWERRGASPFADYEMVNTVAFSRNDLECQLILLARRAGDS